MTVLSVEGAGLEKVNGKFFPDGDYMEQPRWRHESGGNIWLRAVGDPKQPWVIVHTSENDESQEVYYRRSDIDYNDDEGWSVGKDAVGPVPRVSELPDIEGYPEAPSDWAKAPDAKALEGEPLQLVTLDMKERSVKVNEDALGRLEKRLKKEGTYEVAVISVMGAFRTGKSFLLDLMLRYLRHEDHCRASGVHPYAGMKVDAGRGIDKESDQPRECALPPWMTATGEIVDGVKGEGGFTFKGGMDVCTEGIWVWSEPFMREIGGKKIAVLFMDTQGAWDNQMAKEQSATIFGLTAVLSSKLIYNIKQQIQENYVDNLAYFMRFAQSALRQTAVDLEAKTGQSLKDEVETPFQNLNFLVRDWQYFKEEYSVEVCKVQMREHKMRHLNPERVQEADTVKALNGMFHNINCFCLPHPGNKIEKERWTGKVHDIENDFVRMVDEFMQDVFTNALEPKTILGKPLNTVTFPLVLRDFVAAFSDAAPAAMNFTQAFTNCSILLAKESSLKSYTAKMDEAGRKHARGVGPEEFAKINEAIKKQVESEFKKASIFGDADERANTWTAISDNIQALAERYFEDNSRRLEKALVSFANLALLGLVCFVLDMASNWVCDWWSTTCVEVSKLLLLSYCGIVCYIGVYVYLLVNDQGRYAVAIAGGQLWAEIMRLAFVYVELLQRTRFKDLPDLLKTMYEKGVNATINSREVAARLKSGLAETKEDNKKEN